MCIEIHSNVKPKLERNVGIGYKVISVNEKGNDIRPPFMVKQKFKDGEWLKSRKLNREHFLTAYPGSTRKSNDPAEQIGFHICLTYADAIKTKNSINHLAARLMEGQRKLKIVKVRYRKVVAAGFWDVVDSSLSGIKNVVAKEMYIYKNQ